MRIGELAEATGVSVRALRYYEEQGLLDSNRSASGQRLYGLQAVDRVRWIRRLYSVGMQSKTIEKLRPCLDRGEITDVEVEIVAAEREKIEAQIQNLTAKLNRLGTMMGQVASNDCKQTSSPMAEAGTS